MSSLVENGAGTGWTVKDKLSYYRDIVIIKLYSMRETLLFGSNSYSINLNLFLKIKFYLFKKEKSLLTWRQFAWINKKIKFFHQRLNVEHLFFLDLLKRKLKSFIFLFFVFNKHLINLILNPKNFFSTSKNNTSFIHVNKNTISENNELFCQWLVGFTDGDGTFSIANQNNKWSLIFKLSQNTYNLRILHFIKTQLKVGSIYIEKDGKHAHYRIRDLKTLNSTIFPIFDKYSLLTTKQFNYIKLKKAYNILTNNSLCKIEKDKLITQIVLSKPNEDYISPIWSVINNEVINFKSASTVMSKAWLIGFTEAEGSFYLVQKSKNPNRMVHGFEITQKLDKIVLTAIKYILGIKTKVKVTKYGTFSVVTTNSRAIENIIKYFENTMKGMKAVEYKIWSRCYIKHKGDYDSLYKIRSQVRVMKQKINRFLNLGLKK